MSSKSVVIEFKGGGFVVITNLSLLEIFMSRHDWKKVEYIIYDGQHIEGDRVTAIKGSLASGRVRYV